MEMIRKNCDKEIRGIKTSMAEEVEELTKMYSKVSLELILVSR